MTTLPTTKDGLKKNDKVKIPPHVTPDGGNVELNTYLVGKVATFNGIDNLGRATITLDVGGTYYIDPNKLTHN